MKWRVAKYGDPYSEFVLCIWPIQSAHTQQWTHTHREHTPGAVGSIYAAATGEQLGVWWLAQGHLSRGIEDGESAVHSLPPPTIPASPRFELATFRLRVRLSNHYAQDFPFFKCSLIISHYKNASTFSKFVFLSK